MNVARILRTKLDGRPVPSPDITTKSAYENVNSAALTIEGNRGRGRGVYYKLQFGLVCAPTDRHPMAYPRIMGSAECLP